MRLKDRIALVTGGGSGIGEAIARQFAAEGAQVVIAGRTESVLRKAVSGIGEARCCAIRTDVADSASVAKLFDEIEKRFASLDILVNNAGIGVDDMPEYNRIAEARGRESAGAGIQTQWNVTASMSDEIWRQMLAGHLDGTFYCTRAAIKLMAAIKRGSIVNVSSTAGLTGQEGAPHYSAAKAGMLGFTRSVAREVASMNVRVNALCPGFVETDMSRGYSPAVKQGTKGRIPLGRWGTADEVAAAAVFLACDDSSYFTGQTLSPNGGIFIS
jgi:3-oxoacyl-[acyl-carrier protein] reductase